MYQGNRQRRDNKPRTSYQSRNGNGNSQSFGGRNFKKRTIKKLDESLFINKASIPVVKEEITESTVTFQDFALDAKIQRNITDHGYTQPTPIQEKSIPEIIAGKDVIGIANTGTGKTAAFLIPLINKAYKDRNERIIIVTPTRELAMQIADELEVFSRGTELDKVLCIGGADMTRQIKRLQHNPHFVIGTPGRLKDLVDKRKLNLSMFRNVVLDEVDKMVDIGFLNDIKFFISLLPQQRQSLFFSATVTDKVRSILDNFVKDPVTISIKRRETSEHITQEILRVEKGSNKIDMLHDLLTEKGVDKVLIFGRTKWGIEKLMHSLEERGFKAVAIHGNKSQGQRSRALDQFKKDQIKIMLATDVASRGLDIENVTHVINFDAPETYDDYVHRIGRTGRAGKSGTAITFVE